AWTISFWLLMVPAIWYAGQPIAFGVRPLIAAIWRYILASAIAGGATYFVVRQVHALDQAPGASGAALRILVITPLLITSYLSGVVLLHASTRPLRQMVGLLQDMAPWGSLLERVGIKSDTTAVHRDEVAVSDAASSNGNPMVSILIPAYNAEKWIAATIRSALEQTWEPKEIIIVDDGSKDRTLAVARRFESKSVRAYRQEKQGASPGPKQTLSVSNRNYIQGL